VIGIIGIVIVVLLAIFVWPTRYTYDHINIGRNEYPVRINRFTGQAEVLQQNGWRILDKNSSSLNSENEDLPASDISKLSAKPYIPGTGNYLYCDVYNGSDWKVKELIGQFTVFNQDGTVSISRKYQLGIVYPVRPYQSDTFITKLDVTINQGQKWELKIIGARGTK
jgi:hypothetical protein